MLDNFKYKLEQIKLQLFYRLKKIEIDFKTSRSKNEIAKAYGSNNSFVSKFLHILKSNSRQVIRVAVIFMILSITAAGVFMVFKNYKSINQKVSIWFKSHKPAEQSSKNSNRLSAISAEPDTVTEKRTVASAQKPVIPEKPVKEPFIEAQKETPKTVKDTTRVGFFKNLKNIISHSIQNLTKSYERKPPEKKAESPKNLPIVKTPLVIQKNISDTSTAIAETSSIQPSPQTTSFIRKSSIKADYPIIIANKGDSSFYVLSQNALLEWKIAQKFIMTYGGGSIEPKQAAGDRRTPEGLYFIVKMKTKKELQEIYGPLAYVLNYPNDEDIKAGRTGQGIWIHGTSRDTLPGPTRGCLSLANNNLSQLSEFLKDGKGTPVFIVNSGKIANPLELVDFELIDNKHKEFMLEKPASSQDSSVIAFLKKWSADWESRNIDQYQDNYLISKFNSEGVTWARWKQIKLNTFRKYKTIEIELKNITVSETSDTTSEVKFLQFYTSDLKNFENAKKLFLKKDSTWKIYKELTISKGELLL
jgi:hypothetical protein